MNELLEIKYILKSRCRIFTPDFSNIKTLSESHYEFLLEKIIKEVRHLSLIEISKTYKILTN